MSFVDRIAAAPITWGVDGSPGWGYLVSRDRYVREMTSLGLAPKCRDLEEVPYEQLGPGWAKRPRYSCLDGAKLASAFPPGPKPWRKALGEFLFAWKSVDAPKTV